MPHIKTYMRASPDFAELAWFLVTRYLRERAKQRDKDWTHSCFSVFAVRACVRARQCQPVQSGVGRPGEEQHADDGSLLRAGGPLPALRLCKNSSVLHCGFNHF